MSQKPNPLSNSEPWNLVADGYAETTMQMLAQYAEEAVAACGLKPGGTIAVTSWAPLDQSPAMQTMFSALRAIKPDMPEPQRSVATLENPEVFKQEMLAAGFREVKIRSVTKSLFQQVSYPALALGADGYKAQRAANGYSIGERCNTVDAAPSTNPNGRPPAGALRRCGLLVENNYTAQSASCTASRRRTARGMKPAEIGSHRSPSHPSPNSGRAW